MQRVVDAAVIATSLYAGQWLAGQNASSASLLAIAVAVIVYFFVSEAVAVYQSKIAKTATSDMLHVMGSWLITVLILAALAFFSRHGLAFARSSVLGWIVLGGASLALSRMLFRTVTELLLASGLTGRRCAIAGLNKLGVQLWQNARNNPDCGLQVVGFYDDRSPQRLKDVVEDESMFRGGLAKLVELAKAGEIDTVFVTLPMRAEARIKWLLNQLADTTASAYIVPDFFVFELLHSRWGMIGDLPAVSVHETPLYGVDSWLKRTFDVAVASVGLAVISPIMLVCALLVKLSSPGPVFFRQKRYGLDGKEIYVWKFRSMRVCDNGPIVAQATKGDSRITPIGAILRRTSLDELPQLWNVLKGEMSLVGPRPHATGMKTGAALTSSLVGEYAHRHRVKPGLTGWAQVNGYRGETQTLGDVRHRMDCDLYYVDNWSIGLDLEILARTVVTVFRGAY